MGSKVALKEALLFSAVSSHYTTDCTISAPRYTGSVLRRKHWHYYYWYPPCKELGSLIAPSLVYNLRPSSLLILLHPSINPFVALPNPLLLPLSSSKLSYLKPTTSTMRPNTAAVALLFAPLLVAASPDIDLNAVNSAVQNGINNINQVATGINGAGGDLKAIATSAAAQASGKPPPLCPPPILAPRCLPMSYLT